MIKEEDAVGIKKVGIPKRPEALHDGTTDADSL